jgi:hypothetical protein
MPVSSIYITRSSGCTYTVEENITTTSCTNYIVRLNPMINSTDTYEIVVVTGINTETYTGITYSNFKNGVNLPINCP